MQTLAVGQSKVWIESKLGFHQLASNYLLFIELLKLC